MASVRGGRRARGGFGAGPREEWTPPREGRTVTEEARRQARARRGVRDQRGQDRGRKRRRVREPDGPSAREAYEILGVEPGSDESAVQRAYRERIKEVHPDADGDEEAFKRVQRAYDRLTD